MVKSTSKTKKTIQGKLGSLAKAGTKGKKRSSSSKNIALQISNKQKKNQGSSSKATNLGAATHDNNTDSIVDQDEDDDDVVLASIPNHFFISLQKEIIRDRREALRRSLIEQGSNLIPLIVRRTEAYSNEEEIGRASCRERVLMPV